MVKVVNQILRSNDLNLLEIYYNLYHNISLVDVEYLEESVKVSKETVDKNQILETIKLLYIQELDLLPLGSVIKLDSKFLGEDIKSIMFVITNRLLISKDRNDMYDYELVEYPGAVNDNGKRLYITREFISEVVYEGFSNELEESYVSLARSKCMENKLVSRIFISLENEEFNVGGLNYV